MTQQTDIDHSDTSDAELGIVTDEDVDAAIRIDQSITMVRLAPLMMISNVFVPLILCLSVWPILPVWFVATWLGTLCLLNIPILLSWVRLRSRSAPTQVTGRRMSRIGIWSTVLGVTIACGSVFVYQQGNETGRLVSYLCILGLWSGAMISTWKIPHALYGYVTPMAIAMFAILAYNLETAFAADWVLITMIVFLALALWSVNIHQQYLREATRTQLEHNTQSIEIKRRRAAEASLQQSLQELRETQDKLILQEKMASLGAVTAGVAHEIKNPLNFIINFAKLSRDLYKDMQASIEPALPHLEEGNRDDLTDDLSVLGENLERIQSHGIRADGIVKSMLMHSRNDPGTRAPVQVNRLVDEAADLAFHGARAQDPSFNVEVSRDLAADLPALHGSQTELSRVALNLIGNALQAARARAVKEPPDFAPKVHISTYSNDNCTHIRVHDNGHGIAPENRSKLFQPFFTTKGPGEGTGLGLSISYDIVNSHGGEIRVDSQEGEFAEFTVVLPSDAAAMIALAEIRKRRAADADSEAPA
ncbi:MAG: ATP-binding protein [Pseudomonadota bacterium]